MRAAGDLAGIKAEVEKVLRNAAGIWARRLGEYLATAPLTCAAKNVVGVEDVTVNFTDVENRQLAEHEFGVLSGITISMEASHA